MVITGEARPVRRSSRRLACKFQGETRAKSPETSGSGNLSGKHGLTPKSKSLGLPQKNVFIVKVRFLYYYFLLIVEFF